MPRDGARSHFRHTLSLPESIRTKCVRKSDDFILANCDSSLLHELHADSHLHLNKGIVYGIRCPESSQCVLKQLSNGVLKYESPDDCQGCFRKVHNTGCIDF